MLKIKTNIDKVINGSMKFMGKQLKFAHQLATTRLAHKVRAAEKEEINKVFDRPTPFTAKGVLYKSANKSHPYAVVYLNDFVGKGQSQSEYLRHHIFGGARKIKRTEQWLREKNILPNNQYLVPAKNAILNKYGNVSPAEHVNILSYLQAHPEAGYVANVTAKSKEKWDKQGLSYFVLHKDGQPVGIWQRRGKRLRPVFMFSSTPNYRAKRFDFFGVGERLVAKEWPSEFAKAVKDVITGFNK